MFEDVSIRIAHFLEQNSVILGPKDFVAGGFVRDMIYDKPVRDVDLYVSGKLDDKKYYYNGHVFIDEKPLDLFATPKKVVQGFYLSIDQCWYHRGAVGITEAFEETMKTGLVTIDRSVPNWNVSQPNRHPRFHYDKVKAKYPTMEFEEFQDKSMTISGQSATSPDTIPYKYSRRNNDDDFS